MLPDTTLTHALPIDTRPRVNTFLLGSCYFISEVVPFLCVHVVCAKSHKAGELCLFQEEIDVMIVKVLLTDM